MFMHITGGMLVVSAVLYMFKACATRCLQSNSNFGASPYARFEQQQRIVESSAGDVSQEEIYAETSGSSRMNDHEVVLV